jgi:hypothetical protein
VKTLEAQVLTSKTVSWFDVHEAALKKLSASDRERVAEVTEHQADRGGEPHKAAWTRLDEALIETAREQKAPFVVLTSEEMMY